MAIVVESTSTNTHTTGTSLSVTKPSGTVSGDVLLAFHATNSTSTHTPPSGWTELNEWTRGGVTVSVCYLAAGGSEPSSYAFDSSNSGVATAGIMRLSGVDTAAIVDASGESGSGFSSNVECPSVTTTVDGCLVVRFGGFARGDRTVSTQPSGHTVSWEIQSGTGTGDIWNLAAYETQATAGATGVDGWTMSGNGVVERITVAITPAAGGGSGNPWYYYAQQ